MRASIFYLLTFAALLALALLQRPIENLPPLAYSVLGWLPLVLIPVAMATALLLRQSRVFFIMLVFLVIYIYGFPARPSAKREIMVDLMSVVLPLLALILSYSVDRGVLSRYGLIRLTALLLLSLLCEWLVQHQPPWILEFFAWHLLPGLGAMEHWRQPGLLFLAAGLLLLGRHAWRSNHTDSHLMIVLLLGFVVLVQFMRTQVAVDILFAILPLFALLATVLNLLQKAYHDELTGLPGRRALKEQLLRIGSDYVIAMLDVDHFKKFNDTYGHDVGDQVLKFVAEKMRKVGAGGKAYRYGGEEFTFVFAGKSRQDAGAALEAVREDIAKSRFGMRKKGLGRRKDSARGRGAKQYVGVTVSIGASEAHARRDDYEQALKQADRALYDAKEAGRNNLQWK